VAAVSDQLCRGTALAATNQYGRAAAALYFLFYFKKASAALGLIRFARYDSSICRENCGWPSSHEVFLADAARQMQSCLQGSTSLFPVLSAGPTPHVPLDQWEFAIDDGTDVLQRWDWKSFSALPNETITADLHCVTRWSKLGTIWEGVSLDTLLANVKTDAEYALVHSFGDYSTNLPLQDLMNKQGWIAFRFDDEDLAPEHGGPARLLVPHLYLWKSAKWVRRITLMHEDTPGFWEGLGYNNYGDPWREQRYSGDE